ncbi:ferredoxin [Candidatus Woesearchaeota archaeon]|nr:ferredoxin [Candidatus Woesearchaeota archaeon]
MAKYKLSVDAEACIGCGACAATCPDLFDIKETDKGHKAVAKKAETEDLEGAKNAAEVCPVNAIRLVDDSGNKLA